MRQRGRDESIDILENLSHRLAVCRRRRRKLIAQIAGIDGREYGILLRVFQVAADPVDDLMPVAAKLCGRHVAERRRAIRG